MLQGVKKKSNIKVLKQILPIILLLGPFQTIKESQQNIIISWTYSIEMFMSWPNPFYLVDERSESGEISERPHFVIREWKYQERYEFETESEIYSGQEDQFKPSQSSYRMFRILDMQTACRPVTFRRPLFEQPSLKEQGHLFRGLEVTEREHKKSYQVSQIHGVRFQQQKFKIMQKQSQFAF